MANDIRLELTCEVCEAEYVIIHNMKHERPERCAFCGQDEVFTTEEREDV